MANFITRSMEDVERQIKAVIFDLDGTLLDTEPLSTQAIKYVIQPYGGNIDWDLKKRLLGKRGPDWSRIVIEDQKLSEYLTPEQLVQGWESRLVELYPTVKPLPGVEKLTSHFQQTKVKQVICTSSSSRDVAVKRAHNMEMFSRMEFVVCGDAPEVKNVSACTFTCNLNSCF